MHSTSGTVAVQAVTVAVRSADGTAYDFPGATAANVPTSGYTFISGARTFTAGTYQVFAAVLINGTWTNLTPGQTLTVTAVVGTVAFDSLTVPAGAPANQAVTASARVHSTSGNTTVQAITIAVRSADAASTTFPAPQPQRSASGYTYTSGARGFPAGAYQAFVAVLIGGTWTNVGPVKTMTVGAQDNPITFSQDFNGPAGASANSGTSAPTWYTDRAASGPRKRPIGCRRGWIPELSRIGPAAEAGRRSGEHSGTVDTSGSGLVNGPLYYVALFLALQSPPRYVGRDWLRGRC